MSLESDIDDLGTAMRLFFQTMKRSQHWSSVTAEARVSIDRPAAAILHLLMLPRAQGWRVQDLATELGVEAPSVTRKTQELEQAGYIRRRRNPLDRRAIGLQITARGRSVSSRLWQAQCHMIAQTLSSWPASERREFVEMFQRFSNDLSSQLTTTKTAN